GGDFDQVWLRGRGRRVGDARGEWVGCVVGDVVEADDELPVALSDGPLRAKTPVECVVRGGGVLAAEIGQEIDAVELPIGGRLAAGGGDGGGENVEGNDGRGIDFARGEMSFPLD